MSMSTTSVSCALDASQLVRDEQRQRLDCTGRLLPREDNDAGEDFTIPTYEALLHVAPSCAIDGQHAGVRAWRRRVS